MSVVEGDAAFVFGGTGGGGGGAGAVGVGGARVHAGFVEVLVEVFVLFLLGQCGGLISRGNRGEGDLGHVTFEAGVVAEFGEVVEYHSYSQYCVFPLRGIARAGRQGGYTRLSLNT